MGIEDTGVKITTTEDPDAPGRKVIQGAEFDGVSIRPQSLADHLKANNGTVGESTPVSTPTNLGEQTDNGVAPLTKPAETVTVNDPDSLTQLAAGPAVRVNNGVETTPVGDPNEYIDPSTIPPAASGEASGDSPEAKE